MEPDAIGTMVGAEVRRVILTDRDHSARTQQAASFHLGVSDIGHCQEFARRIIVGEPESDPRNPRGVFAAFIGTALGDAIEKALAREHPTWIFQTTVRFPIPSGGEVQGHPDIVIPPGDPDYPQGVWDLKSVNGFDSRRRYGQSRQQRWQVAMYVAALIADGVLDATQPIFMGDVYIDRSGEEVEPFVLLEEYDPEILHEIDDWIEDVKYAVIHGEEAQREPSREFCASWCPRFTACRGGDTDVSGLIEDEEIVAAAHAYIEASAAEAEAKRRKTKASIVLHRAPEGGSTGEIQFRWVTVGGGEVHYTRQSYQKLSISPVRSAR